VSTVDFAKKLMGQVVFLYFLQKRGWLGVPKGKNWGDGPRDFLRRLAKSQYGSYTNFFNDILEPLFYATLATDRGHLAWCSQFQCRIPFLNGGLFEPLADYDWKKTDILIPNRLFTNTDPVDDGITGSGIFDVFDRYNFTVNEAEPLEKEVAIDPEMLGKVFENLIEDNLRRGVGAYYTPREIVHYMCQQSLINYLDTAINTRESTPKPVKARQVILLGTDAPQQTTLKVEEHDEAVPRADIEIFVHLGEQISHNQAVETNHRIKMPRSIEQNAKLIDDKLAAIAVCDPAVGSGAFPVGMMTEIVRARSSLTPYFDAAPERTPYLFKRHAIQSCLYGVDIDAGAVEIAKLRLWLSLIVDEEDVRQIRPLPNLDYKIIVGNALVGFPFRSARLSEIEQLKRQFFDESDHEAKINLRQRIDRLINASFAASRMSLGFEVNFDFAIYFSEVFTGKGGFDVVIGNPPYIRIQALNETVPEQVAYFKQYYKSTARGNYDLYVVFVERGLQLLHAHGHLGFILPHKFFNAQYGLPLRGLIAQGRHLGHVLHFGHHQIFPGATNYVCLLFLARGGTEACRFARPESLADWLVSQRAPEVSIASSRITDAEWNFAVGKHAELFERLQAMPVKLGAIADVFVGLQTSADDVFIMNFISETARTITLRSKVLRRDWTFETYLLHPVVSGTDVSPFGVLPRRQFILFPYHVSGEHADLIPMKELAEAYPRAADYLRLNRHRLEERERGKFKGDAWHRFGRSQNLGIQRRVKLCVPRLVEYLHAAADLDGTHVLDNVDVGGVTLRSEAGGHHLLYLMALLNSRLLRWYFPHISAPFRGGYRSANKQFLALVPFRPIDFSVITERCEHETVVKLVEQILAAKRRDPSVDTRTAEREIDEIVYRLYNLTLAEVALVESASADSRIAEVPA
jgi:hypothetical protein